VWTVPTLTGGSDSPMRALRPEVCYRVQLAAHKRDRGADSNRLSTPATWLGPPVEGSVTVAQ